MSRNPKGGSRVWGMSPGVPVLRYTPMKKLLLLLALSPALAQAQVQVQAGASFTLDLPVVIPQLVIVQPGIQVVPDVDYEVFFVNGFYWTRHEGGWYRSRSPRAGWVYMPRNVPPGLTRMPPGHYKRWKPAKHGGPGPAYRPAPVLRGPPPGPAFRHEERREERHERREERREHGGDRDKGGRGEKHGGGHGRD